MANAGKTAAYGCAVLAGGSGSRMGGVNKAALPAEQGTATMLERTCRILCAAEMPCYLSVSAYEQDTPQGWRIVPDAAYLQGLVSLPVEKGGAAAGPLGGIYACLCKAAEDGLDGLFFVPCDAPRYEADVIEKMLPHIEQKGADSVDAADDLPGSVIWRTADGRLQVAFGWYSVSCLPVLRKQLQEGNYKVQDALANLRVLELLAAEEGLAEERFLNINTPEDFTRL